MAIVLRDYQEAGAAQVRSLFGQRVSSVVVVSPTGSGKGAMAAYVLTEAAQKGTQSLFIVHRREIIRDVYKRLRNNGAPCGMILAGESEDPTAPIQVCSVQTLFARGTRPPASFIVWDEAQHATAKSYRTVRDAYPRAKHLGLSIGPDSRCEFVGGPFGAGWTGRIEDAYAIAAVAFPSSSTDGYDRLTATGVFSRGWTGSRFGWKPVREFIRHACTTSTTQVAFRGQRLVATNDHSIFEVTKTGLAEKRTDALSADAVLAHDTGCDWTIGDEPLLAAWDLVPYCHVAVSLAGVTARDLGASPQQWYSWRRRVHGHGLSIAVYLKHRSILPEPTLVYTEGADGNWSVPSFRASQLAYLIGVYVGNGWLDFKRTAVSVRTDRVAAFVNYISELSIMRVAVNETPRTGATEVRFGNAFLVAMLSRLFPNQTAPTKRIPPWILTTWSEEARRELLRGLMDTDGHSAMRERDRYRGVYTTTSPGLASDIMCLLRSLGVTASIRTMPPCEGGTIDGRTVVGALPRFDLHWSMHALAGNNDGHHGLRSRFHVPNIHEMPIDLAEPCAPPAFVYDLSMDGHPSFVANGVLVHNTATPQRADRTALGNVFQAMVVLASTSELTARGFLVPCATFAPDRHLGENLAQDPVAAYIEHGEGKRAFVFVDRTAIAAELAGRFREAGIEAASIDGKTLDAVRRRRLDLFREGHIRVLVNVNVFTEGVDVPEAKVCILGKKCVTPAVFLQAGGRILRPCNGEGNAILIDLCGNIHSHGLLADDRTFSLTGKPITNVEDDKADNDPFPCPRGCGAYVRTLHISESGPGCPGCGWKQDPKPMAEILGETLHAYGEQLSLPLALARPA